MTDPAQARRVVEHIHNQLTAMGDRRSLFDDNLRLGDLFSLIAAQMVALDIAVRRVSSVEGGPLEHVVDEVLGETHTVMSGRRSDG